MSTRFLHPVLFAGLTLCFLGLATAAPASSAWLTRAWQTDDGLPNNQVTALAQSRDGYLWIGTAVGLARFDGVHFTDFPYSNKATNEDQGVSELQPDPSGGFLIRTRRGDLVRLSPDLSRVSPVGKGLPHARVLAAIQDPAGCLWIAYPDSIWQVKNGVGSRLTGYQNMPSSGFTGRFAVDRDRNVWVAKGNGVYLFRQGKFESITNTTYRAHLTVSRTGGVWIASGRQLFKCFTNGTLLYYGSFIPAVMHTGSTTVLEDHTGAVWIGTSGGLVRYAGSGFEKIETSHPDILSLVEDQEGNIWAGTAGGGLDRISRRSIQLEGLGFGTSLAAIQSICQDTNGVLWGATQDGLLVSRVNDRWVPALTNAPWTNAVDSVAADHDGRLWIGTRNSGLYLMTNGQFMNWDLGRGLTSRVILDLFPAANGDLWIVGEAPISLQRLHDGQLYSLKVPRNIGRITALAEDAAGNIWVGSALGALMRVEGDQLVNESSLIKFSRRAILCLHTLDDALWIGYEGAGLGRLKGKHYDQVRTDQGLLDDYISQMAADRDGWLWFGGERGIFKVRQSELENVMAGRADAVRSVTYGQNEGLFSMEASSANVSPFAFPGAFCGRNGRLWFPLRKALAVVDPNIQPARTAPPPVLLSQVIMDGRTIASYGGLAPNPAPVNLKAPNPSLQLPPSHHHLQIRFTAINLSTPDNIRFRYQLLGFDNDWIDAGNERVADYSRLPAGKYSFRVEAGIGDGPWNETPTTLAFIVTPFFWQRWWFCLGALLLFTSIVIAIVRYISFRRLQARMRLIEQRAALDKERTRIARDLHDDLGCSLNKVALTLDMTQRGIESTGTVNGKLEHCSTMVRQVAKSVDEIVWAINPRNDTLRYLVDYVSQFAVEFLHAANIPCRVDLPDNPPARVVSPEVRHHLFLVVKEALNNIARHAHASEVRLQVVAADDRVTVIIEDNGCGFAQAPDNASSDGLRNMWQRMEEIGGRFHLESQPGKGTRVTFSYAWPPDSASPRNPNMPFPFAESRGK